MSAIQKWFGGFMMIIDGITTIFSGRTFGLYIGYVEWCVRRNFDRKRGK